jgi:DNA-binding HxlR family transcriptional regulator
MQETLGQFCPLALASEVLTPKWTLLILRELAAGSSRFSDIRRGVPRISATLLKQRLDALEFAGLVERRASGRSDGQDYVLTEAGLELKPILKGIGEWGQRWAREIRAEDLDPGWLVWNIRRRLDTDAMPSGRTVIEICFTDAPRNCRNFWLIQNRGAVDVCLKPPGFEVDVIMRTSVRVLAEVWRGIRPIKAEIGAGRIRLDGKADLCRALPSWLLLSVYAPIKSLRHAPPAELEPG